MELSEDDFDSDDFYVLIVEEPGDPVQDQDSGFNTTGKDMQKIQCDKDLLAVKIEPSEVKLEPNDINDGHFNDFDGTIKKYVQAMKSEQKMSVTKTRKLYEFSDNQYTCLYCIHSSSSEKNAIRHYQFRHKQKLYKCLACSAGFKRHDTMLFHETYCQAENAHLVRLAREVYAGGKSRPKMSRKERRAFKIPCKICGKVVSLANMKLHLFVHSDEKRYGCPYCSARFRTKRSQNAHLNAHTGLRPYPCDKCTNAYTSDTALRAHKLDHGESAYHCHYCKRSYKRKHSLKQHLITHTDGNEYLCNECGKVLYNKLAMEHHAKVHRAGVTRFTCSDCGKMYSKMTGLNFHMRNKHGREIITRKMFFNKLPTLKDEKSVLDNVSSLSEKYIGDIKPILEDEDGEKIDT